MFKISKSRKANKFYNLVGIEILEFMQEAYIEENHNELKRYMEEFSEVGDFNLYRYGNLSIYYDDIYKILEIAGYNVKYISVNKLENMYISAIRFMSFVISWKIRRFEKGELSSTMSMRKEFCESILYLMNSEEYIELWN